MKLFDSELQVMEVLWEKGDLCAREVARILADKIGWNKNTTYTIIHKLIGKGAIERLDPGFICRPLLLRQLAQRDAARQLIDRFFNGAASDLFACLLQDGPIDPGELAALRKLVEAQDNSK